MELQDMPPNSVPGTEATFVLEDQELDRIAFELWQRGSLPELLETSQTELDEVACHASCL